MTLRILTKAGGRRGIAMLVTLLFLALFACLAVAIAASANMNMILTRNRFQAQQAGALAETGLQFTQRHLGGLRVPATDNASDLHKAIAEQLAIVLVDSPMVNAAAIHWDATQVTLPAITLLRPDGRMGELDLCIMASGGTADNTTVTIDSTGHFGTAARRSLYNMTVQRGRSVLLDYGIASKSPIAFVGNARIAGANRPEEGSVLSATYSTTQAITMTGNCSTSGDVAIVNPQGQIVKRGTVTIQGAERIGVDEPEWPEVDVSVFRPYATNVYSGSGAGDLTLSNIIIPPNTNPTFSGNVTIQGVVYVQSPNKVMFSGNTTVVGVIVCEEPAVNDLKKNYVHFTGNMSTSGVENLPADPAYDGLRELTGTFLLAPGFSTKFTGNFSTINGCVVASAFEFSGDASGRIKGGVLNLRDSTFRIAGNAPILIDRDSASPNPAGLTTSWRLVCVSGSYSE
jgi:hypothetical protein